MNRTSLIYFSASKEPHNAWHLQSYLILILFSAAKALGGMTSDNYRMFGLITHHYVYY